MSGAVIILAIFLAAVIGIVVPWVMIPKPRKVA
jgi:hypothetical protein